MILDLYPDHIQQWDQIIIAIAGDSDVRFSDVLVIIGDDVTNRPVITNRTPMTTADHHLTFVAGDGGAALAGLFLGGASLAELPDVGAHLEEAHVHAVAAGAVEARLVRLDLLAVLVVSHHVETAGRCAGGRPRGREREHGHIAGHRSQVTARHRSHREQVARSARRPQIAHIAAVSGPLASGHGLSEPGTPAPLGRHETFYRAEHIQLNELVCISWWYLQTGAWALSLSVTMGLLGLTFNKK